MLTFGFLKMEGYDEFLTALAEHGPFPAGTVFGCIISAFFFNLASKERVERDKINLEREKELFKQNSLKDERIDKLHQKLAEKNRKDSEE